MTAETLQMEALKIISSEVISCLHFYVSISGRFYSVCPKNAGNGPEGERARAAERQHCLAQNTSTYMSGCRHQAAQTGCFRVREVCSLPAEAATSLKSAAAEPVPRRAAREPARVPQPRAACLHPGVPGAGRRRSIPPFTPQVRGITWVPSSSLF